MNGYEQMVEAVNLALKSDRSPALSDDEIDLVFCSFNIDGERDVKKVVKIIEMERREDA